MEWVQPRDVTKRNFTCGYCGKDVGPSKGYITSDGANQIFICPKCDQPTFIDAYKNQTPYPRIGNNIEGISDTGVKALYQEARDCTSAGAFTGAVMVCRKILMNLAVQHSAKENENFVFYVNFLANGGFIPPKGKEWVDAIRKLGNEATHEIALMTEKDAQLILRFTEALLRFNYEIPHIFETHKTS